MLELTPVDARLVPGPRSGTGAVPGPRPRTVVVIDDHRTIADLLRFAIDAEAGLRCVGVAYDLVGGLSLVITRQPDLVLMDYEFSHDERDGLTASTVITSRFPDIHVVLLTAHADALPLERTVEARVSAVVAKDGSPTELMEVLRDTAAGNPPALPGGPRSPSAGVDHLAKKVNLSPREQDVLAMLMLGMRSDAIATELGISMNTCRGYVKALLWKLGAHSRLEAVAIARRRGLVPDG